MSNTPVYDTTLNNALAHAEETGNDHIFDELAEMDAKTNPDTEAARKRRDHEEMVAALRRAINNQVAIVGPFGE